MSPGKKPTATILIPAYNEEKSIGSAVLLAKKYGAVVVIDDGSKDRTATVAAAAGAKVVRHPSNRGYGAALKMAFTYAKTSSSAAFVIMDADFQHEPSEIPLLLAPILSGKADVSIGSRFLGKFIEPPPYRKEGVMLLNRLSATDGKNRIDFQCGFRAFSKKAMSKIEFSEDSYPAAAEIMVSAQRAGLRVAEVPVQVRYYAGKPKNLVAQVAELSEYVARQIIKRNPLMFFGAAGILSLAISAAIGIFVVNTFYRSRVLPIGSAFLTIFMGVVGVILMSTAINLYALKLALEKNNKG